MRQCWALVPRVRIYSPLRHTGKSEVAQSRPTLCDPMDCSPPGSSVHGILQARILEWVAIPSSGDLPDPGIKPRSPALSALEGGFFTTSAPWVKTPCCCLVAESCHRVRLPCDPIDCHPSSSSIHEISLARILEWVAISFSRGSSQTRDQTHISCIDRWIL